MPNVPNRPDPAHGGPGQTPWPGPHGAGRLRVLIVQADPAAAERLAAQVRQWGHEVAVAGAAALALALAEARPPHVVLLGAELGAPALALARELYRRALPHEIFLVAPAGPGGPASGVSVYALRAVNLSASLEALAAQEALRAPRAEAGAPADAGPESEPI
jgi:CheY-like chemotaxis protein